MEFVADTLVREFKTGANNQVAATRLIDFYSVKAGSGNLKKVEPHFVPISTIHTGLFTQVFFLKFVNFWL